MFRLGFLQAWSGEPKPEYFQVVKELRRWDEDGEMSWLVGWLLIFGWL